MRTLWLLTIVLAGGALSAAFGFSDQTRRANRCCECLVERACTDVAADTCVSILQTPPEEAGGAPWRYQSLLGGLDDATECAQQETFTDFDEPRIGCGRVCGAFVVE